MDYNDTSLYIAIVNSPLMPTRKDVRNAVWSKIKKSSEKITVIEDSQSVIYNGTIIGFRVMDVPKIKRYILTFFPYGENISSWCKRESTTAAQNVIDFCREVGDEIDIKVVNGPLSFKKKYLNEKLMIDTSNWYVSFPLIGEKQYLEDFMKEAPTVGYASVLEKVNYKKNKFLIFTETYKHGGMSFDILRRILQDFGEVSPKPHSLLTAMEIGEKLYPKERNVFIFMDKEEVMAKLYQKMRIFFDQKRIPTQTVWERTIRNKLVKWPGTKANIILEIMTKTGKKPLVLQPPEESITVDGILCLSDIESITQRIFGALFTFTKEGLEAKEDVQIYRDIDFTTKNYKIEFPEEELQTLTERISTLISIKDINIDVLITKKWKKENLEKLVSNLRNNNIEVNKIYYISSMTSRFVDEYGLYRKRSNLYPYILINDKLAFLRTCTEIRIYPNLSSLFIELMWPQDGKIGEDDLKKILWLVKKRIYRIQEFYVLKLPEPIQIFHNVRNMFLGGVKGSLTIPLRLLI